MQVCIDYQPAVAQGAGIGRYTRVLAEKLVKTAASDDRLCLFYLDYRRKVPPDPLPGAESRACRLLPGRMLQRCWRHLGWPAFDQLAGPADVFHFTNFIMPPLRRGRSVVTIFDMSFERYPQFAEERNLRYLRAGLRRTVERADAIITISQFSADEIAALLPASRGKLHAIALGIAPSFAPAGSDAIAALRQSLGLARPYLLTVGTIEPRKNLSFLVEVFERLNQPELELVIAGMAGWKCEPIFERFRNSPLADRIRYLEYVPDESLAALYSGAELFVVPSHYEGFGFPPLEAMACGTAVVSSSGGSLPEVLGEAARIMPDFEIERWSSAIGSLLNDTEQKAALSEAGLQQAAGYRWEKTASATWQVYREVCR